MSKARMYQQSLFLRVSQAWMMMMMMTICVVVDESGLSSFLHIRDFCTDLHVATHGGTDIFSNTTHHLFHQLCLHTFRHLFIQHP